MEGKRGSTARSSAAGSLGALLSVAAHYLPKFLTAIRVHQHSQPVGLAPTHFINSKPNDTFTKKNITARIFTSWAFLEVISLIWLLLEWRASGFLMRISGPPRPPSPPLLFLAFPPSFTDSWDFACRCILTQFPRLFLLFNRFVLSYATHQSINQCVIICNLLRLYNAAHFMPVSRSAAVAAVIAEASSEEVTTNV